MIKIAIIGGGYTGCSAAFTAAQNGLSVFDGANWYNFTTSDGLIDNTIQAIHVSSSGVWLGTDFGVSYVDLPNLFSGGIITSYTTADGLGNNVIKCQSIYTNLWSFMGGVYSS